MPSRIRREIEIIRYTKSNDKKKCILLSVLALLGIVLFASFYITMVLYESESSVQMVYIECNKPALYKTSSKFLSLGLDAVVIARGFKDFNFTDPKLIAMMKFLSPAYLRVGGNLADRLSFSFNNETDKETEEFYQSQYTEEMSDYPNISLSASDWLKLNKVANVTNMELFFGLNALKRLRNGSWDSRNAETMIKFSNEHGLKLNWELGNEPNSFRHKFNQEVNATQMAKDFATLRRILNKYSNYKYSFLVGPDVTRPQHNPESEIYLEEFVENIKNTVNKITWHQYYVNGHNTSVNDFLNPKIYDLLQFQISKVKNITNKTGKSIWLGETSSAYGGGAPGLSDTFIGSFMWVDKLGLAAKMGVEVLMRQSIVHGNYSLLDRNYNPNPDWWISVIYKSLVAPTVLPYRNITSEKVRLYVHCTTKKVNKGVTIFGFNVDKNEARVRIKFEGSRPPQYAYVLQLQTNNLKSKNVYCNGQLLKMLPGNRLPKIAAVRKDISDYLIIHPFSIVFWIVPNVEVRACF